MGDAERVAGEHDTAVSPVVFEGQHPDIQIVVGSVGGRGPTAISGHPQRLLGGDDRLGQPRLPTGVNGLDGAEAADDCQADNEQESRGVHGAFPHKQQW